MSQSQRKAVPDDNVPERHGKHRLDLMQPRMARHLAMFRPSEENVADLVATASREIPGLAPVEEVLRVFRHNPDFILAVARKTRFDEKTPVGEGFIAMLPLNLLGLQHLAL